LPYCISRYFCWHAFANLSEARNFWTASSMSSYLSFGDMSVICSASHLRSLYWEVWSLIC
jgi:deoxyribodipyrimidine photolyase